MDQKKQFLLLIGALIIVIILIVIIPNPNFGQINLLSGNQQIASENIIRDSTLALNGEWETSTSSYQNVVDEGGVHMLQTDATGLILTQSIGSSLVAGKSALTITGTIQSTEERDTFFIVLKDTEGRELYRESVDPRQPFTLNKDLSITEQQFASTGLTLMVELPGDASYRVESLAMSIQ